jgi:serine/threonine protein kinase
MEEQDDTFQSIAEYRQAAKVDHVVNQVGGIWNPMNDSSFYGSDLPEGDSILLFQKSSERDRAALEQFQMISIVGRGTFAKVFLVYLPTNGKYYALKSMRKDVIIDKNSVENINLERLIMLQVDHPFIVSMQYLFQRSYRVYFVMDYVDGGELFQYMKSKRHFSQENVAFYSAQIACALSYLHKNNIMYRDLKPENILVAKDGYVKLSDFGLAKQAKVSNTFCGTPEYISPEMLLGTGHDHTSDWWALGVLIYEMLTGVPPFYDKNRNVMFLNIERAKLRWPNQQRHGISVSDSGKDII